MNKITITLVAVMGYFITSSVNASPSSVWSNRLIAPESQLQQRDSSDSSAKVKLKARLLVFDHAQFKSRLNKLPNQETSLVSRSSDLLEAKTFTIPLPKGSSVDVIARPTSVMAPELQKQFPELRTWRIEGKKDPAIHGRVEFSQHGFHAMLVMPDGDTVFVEPENNSTDGENTSKTRNYLSFSKNVNAKSFSTNFQCSVNTDHSIKTRSSDLTSRELQSRPASSLITYRLAVAATGEYTRFHGGTKSQALSAIVTTINRVNEIYERDLGITFQLVAEEADIIYTNPISDPYTNSDGAFLVDENISNLTRFRALSRDKFDIGHVFSTGAGGVAVFEAACSAPAKAGGATGFDSPIGDVFSIDYVAHELGHQLGANHTFNSTTGNCGGGNRAGGFAVEPGSGSTVMAYAGLCDDEGREIYNNVQANTDAAFHAISISQILKYSRSSSEQGSSCGTRVAVTNHDPVPNAGQDNTIPANTPFILSGTGSDPNTGDSLTYSWEQNDRGTESHINVDKGDNAIIRSFLPQRTGTRYIPRLADLFQNKRLRAEKLPVDTRDLNFVLTVRDGKGGFEFDNLHLSVVNTGSTFQVTSHSAESNLEVGRSTQVRWNVAGTATSPISCNTVDIGLIQSNGARIDVLLQAPNDGVDTVLIPNNALGMNAARFIVNCSDNETTFFNISSADLRIVALNSGSGSSGSSTGGTSSGGSGGGSVTFNMMLLLFLMVLLRLANGIRSQRIKQKVFSQ